MAMFSEENEFRNNKETFKTLNIAFICFIIASKCDSDLHGHI